MFHQGRTKVAELLEKLTAKEALIKLVVQGSSVRLESSVRSTADNFRLSRNNFEGDGLPHG